jgi:inorganic triphosphatase YgiF
MGREFELKFATTADVQAAIRQAYDGFRKIAMETTYFDTPDGALSARKVTLRLRKENDDCVCTLKTPLPDGSRGEWECQAVDIHDGLAALVRLGAPKQVLLLAQAGLQPVCGAKFIRFAAEVATTDSTMELALDSGVLLGGGKEMALCEVEVELKTGSDRAALDFANHLAATYGLIAEHKSKFRRALDLAKGE